MSELERLELLDRLRSIADCDVCLGCQDVALGALNGSTRPVSVGEALAALHALVCWEAQMGGWEAPAWREARRVVEKAQAGGMF